MNILMATNTYLPMMGGLERSIELFTNEFRKRGHRVLIVAPEYEKQPKNETDVIRVPAIQHFSGSAFSFKLPVPSVLTEAIKSFKPDVIHVHHPFVMGETALRIAYTQQAPLVFTYHTLFEKNFSYYLPGAPVAFKKFIFELTIGYANLCDQVIAPSESIAEILKEHGVKSPIAVIPTGLHLDQFKKGTGEKFRKELKIPENAFVIGHVGRLAAEKNLHFLARASAAFMEKEPSAYFVIVGGGPLEEAILHYFSRLKLENKLIMAGVRKGSKLIEAYHAMDAFVFSSQSETQGVVLAEAMACGVPVVGVDAPGVRDIVRDKKNGRLVPSENEEKFSEALSWICKRTEKEKKELGNGAQDTASEFAIQDCANRALALYAGLKAKAVVEREKAESAWSSILQRIKAEFDLIANLTKATTGALIPGNKTEDIITSA